MHDQTISQHTGWTGCAKTASADFFWKYGVWMNDDVLRDKCRLMVIFVCFPCAGYQGCCPQNPDLHHTHWQKPQVGSSIFVNLETIHRHTLELWHTHPHTPSTAFQHLPPNSARFSYATEGALFISAQLSTDTVSALQKVRVLIIL